MQIKATIGYHFTPVRMAIIKRCTNRLPLWRSGLRIWRSHCSSSTHCYGMGLITGPGTFICHRHSQKKFTNNMLERVWSKRNPPTLDGNVNQQNHCGEQYGGSLKTKYRTTIWFSNPTPGHISRENHNSKRRMQPNVHRSTIYNNPEACPLRWMDKDVVSTSKGILVSHKKEWNNAICSNMDATRDYYTKWSQTEKDKYRMISLLCGI